MEDLKLSQVVSYLVGLKTKASGSWVLTFETQENISPALIEYFAARRQNPGHLLFLSRPGEPEDVVDLPELTTDPGQKTPSQRLRACLFVLWEQQGKKGDFESFYRSKMERVIEWVKEKLN